MQSASAKCERVYKLKGIKFIFISLSLALRLLQVMCQLYAIIWSATSRQACALLTHTQICGLATALMAHGAYASYQSSTHTQCRSMLLGAKKEGATLSSPFLLGMQWPCTGQCGATQCVCVVCV